MLGDHLFPERVPIKAPAPVLETAFMEFTPQFVWLKYRLDNGTERILYVMSQEEYSALELKSN